MQIYPECVESVKSVKIVFVRDTIYIFSSGSQSNNKKSQCFKGAIFACEKRFFNFHGGGDEQNHAYEYKRRKMNKKQKTGMKSS